MFERFKQWFGLKRPVGSAEEAVAPNITEEQGSAEFFAKTGFMIKSNDEIIKEVEEKILERYFESSSSEEDIGDEFLVNNVVYKDQLPDDKINKDYVGAFVILGMLQAYAEYAKKNLEYPNFRRNQEAILSALYHANLNEELMIEIKKLFQPSSEQGKVSPAPLLKQFSGSLRESISQYLSGMDADYNSAVREKRSQQFFYRNWDRLRSSRLVVWIFGKKKEEAVASEFLKQHLPNEAQSSIAAEKLEEEIAKGFLAQLENDNAVVSFDSVNQIFSDNELSEQEKKTLKVMQENFSKNFMEYRRGEISMTNLVNAYMNSDLKKVQPKQNNEYIKKMKKIQSIMMEALVIYDKNIVEKTKEALSILSSHENKKEDFKLLLEQMATKFSSVLWHVGCKELVWEFISNLVGEAVDQIINQLGDQLKRGKIPTGKSNSQDFFETEIKPLFNALNIFSEKKEMMQDENLLESEYTTFKDRIKNSLEIYLRMSYKRFESMENDELLVNLLQTHFAENKKLQDFCNFDPDKSGNLFPDHQKSLIVLVVNKAMHKKYSVGFSILTPNLCDVDGFFNSISLPEEVGEYFQTIKEEKQGEILKVITKAFKELLLEYNKDFEINHPISESVTPEGSNSLLFYFQRYCREIDEKFKDFTDTQPSFLLLVEAEKKSYLLSLFKECWKQIKPPQNPLRQTELCKATEQRELEDFHAKMQFIFKTMEKNEIVQSCLNPLKVESGDDQSSLLKLKQLLEPTGDSAQTNNGLQDYSIVATRSRAQSHVSITSASKPPIN